MQQVFEVDPRITLAELAELVKAHFKLNDSEIYYFLSTIEGDFGRNDCNGYEIAACLHILVEALDKKYSCSHKLDALDFLSNLGIVTEEQKIKITLNHILDAIHSKEFELSEHLYLNLPNPFEIKIDETENAVVCYAAQADNAGLANFIILKALEVGRTDLIKKMMDIDRIANNSRHKIISGLIQAYAQFLAEGNKLLSIPEMNDIPLDVATNILIMNEYDLHNILSKEEKIILATHFEYYNLEDELSTVIIMMTNIRSIREAYLAALEENGKLLAECTNDSPENSECRLKCLDAPILVRIASFLPPSKNNIKEDKKAYNRIATGFLGFSGFFKAIDKAESAEQTGPTEQSDPEGPKPD